MDKTYTYKDLAVELHCSVRTVKTHVKKLGLKSIGKKGNSYLFNYDTLAELSRSMVKSQEDKTKNFTKTAQENGALYALQKSFEDLTDENRELLKEYAEEHSDHDKLVSRIEELTQQVQTLQNVIEDLSRTTKTSSAKTQHFIKTVHSVDYSRLAQYLVREMDDQSRLHAVN